MIRIELKNFKTRAEALVLNRELILDPVCVIRTEDNDLASSVLTAMLGMGREHSGEILIDGIAVQELILSEPLPRIFGYVFAHGIMLANLNLRENLLLPYKLIKDNSADDTFEDELAIWMERFELIVDLNLRPSMVKPSVIKILSLIRAMLFNPRILLLDDPYYLLDQKQRRRILTVLSELRSTQHMLINSSDDDFCIGFAKHSVEL